MQNNASTRQFFSSQSSEETKKMAIPFFLNPIEILGQDNVGDQNLGTCKVVLKYAEHSISLNFPISFDFPITFKLEYNGEITLSLKMYEFEFNWTTHNE